MEFAVLSKATPEERFTVMFIAAEVAITVVVGGAFFAGLAKILL
jgi:hypothetical protein